MKKKDSKKGKEKKGGKSKKALKNKSAKKNKKKNVAKKSSVKAKTSSSHLRLQILHAFALHSAVAGGPFKPKEEVAHLVQIPNYEQVLVGNTQITPEEFEHWHQTNAQLIVESNAEISIGWATKMINLYLKTMVYVAQEGRPNLLALLHPPIETELWKQIKEKYADRLDIVELTHSQTKIKDIATYEQYKTILQGLKIIAEEQNILLVEVEAISDAPII